MVINGYHQRLPSAIDNHWMMVLMTMGYNGLSLDDGNDGDTIAIDDYPLAIDELFNHRFADHQQDSY